MTVQRQSALSPVERARKIAAVLWLTLFLNWSVALLKLALGFTTHCMVIIADGFHSLSDGLSNIVGLAGIRISAHPADVDHPYGHQKYETLASTVIAFFLFVVSYGILSHSVQAFLSPRVPEVTPLSFGVMALTLVINAFVARYERRKARELKSDLLSSDAWHTLSDVFITLSVFVALVCIYFKIRNLDAVFSFGIGAFIAVTAIGILKRGSDILCDKAVIDTRRIEEIVMRVDGVRDCHEIRTRGRQEEVYVDLHVLVDSDMTVQESHKLANIIENNIRKGILGVHDVVVHIEPVSHGHEEIEDTGNGKK